MTSISENKQEDAGTELSPQVFAMRPMKKTEFQSQKLALEILSYQTC